MQEIRAPLLSGDQATLEAQALGRSPAPEGLKKEPHCPSRAVWPPTHANGKRRHLRIEGPPRRAALNCSPQGKEISSLEIDAGARIKEVEVVEGCRDVLQIFVDQSHVRREMLPDCEEMHPGLF